MLKPKNETTFPNHCKRLSGYFRSCNRRLFIILIFHRKHFSLTKHCKQFVLRRIFGKTKKLSRTSRLYFVVNDKNDRKRQKTRIYCRDCNKLFAILQRTTKSQKIAVSSDNTDSDKLYKKILKEASEHFTALTFFDWPE